MTDDALKRSERDSILSRVRELDESLKSGASGGAPGQAHSLREEYYARLAEYFDRLPRVRMSVCPFCDAVLKRSFDPYGLDGPWWHVDLLVDVQEPAACEHFQVLLGAFRLGGDRTPSEVREKVQPGPEVPFVVPEILNLPGMIAVVAEIGTENGDHAWPIGYFSDEEIDPAFLHQPWLREMFWFADVDSGDTAWSMSNAAWEFDLGPWLSRGALRWTDLTGDPPEVRRLTEGRTCPFRNLPGERSPQQFAWGARTLMEPPSGEFVNPFE